MADDNNDAAAPAREETDPANPPAVSNLMLFSPWHFYSPWLIAELEESGL